ncbi:hypothetical protein J7K27_01240 [Candidatus Bathyarchaeota archaeon]|nr:hypothetical protein [Candidatus Bathyarchaeota archaeon]
MKLRKHEKILIFTAIIINLLLKIFNVDSKLPANVKKCDIWEDFVNWILNGLQSIWDAIVGFFTSIGQAIANAIGGFFQSVINAIAGFFQWVATTLQYLIYQIFIAPLQSIINSFASMPFPLNYLAWIFVAISIVFVVIIVWKYAIKENIPVIGKYL